MVNMLFRNEKLFSVHIEKYTLTVHSVTAWLTNSEILFDLDLKN